MKKSLQRVHLCWTEFRVATETLFLGELHDYSAYQYLLNVFLEVLRSPDQVSTESNDAQVLQVMTHPKVENGAFNDS